MMVVRFFIGLAFALVWLLFLCSIYWVFVDDAQADAARQAPACKEQVTWQVIADGPNGPRQAEWGFCWEVDFNE